VVVVVSMTRMVRAVIMVVVVIVVVIVGGHGSGPWNVATFGRARQAGENRLSYVLPHDLPGAPARPCDDGPCHGVIRPH
jgi:hypothetical protein